MQRSNHLKKGLIFIGACALLGAMLFLMTRCSFNSTTNVIDNLETNMENCGADSVELELGRVAVKGTLQILAAKQDTDGYDQHVLEIQEITCFPRSTLDELARGTGTSPAKPVTFLIGHDPIGTQDNFRNRFDYEPGVAGEEMPTPPRDMHFGEASWTVSSKQARLSVDWYADFAQWIRQQYPAGPVVDDAVSAIDENLSALDPAFCNNAELENGQWVRDSEGRIIVMENDVCRLGTADEIASIAQE